MDLHCENCLFHKVFKYEKTNDYRFHINMSTVRRSFEVLLRSSIAGPLTLPMFWKLWSTLCGKATIRVKIHSPSFRKKNISRPLLWTPSIEIQLDFFVSQQLDISPRMFLFITAMPSWVRAGIGSIPRSLSIGIVFRFALHPSVHVLHAVLPAPQHGHTRTTLLM